HQFLQHFRAMRSCVESAKRAIYGSGVMVDDPIEYSRRKFVASSGSMFATLAAIKTAFAQTVSQLPAPGPGWRSDEGYWDKIRQKFMLEDGLAYLNNGTVGPTPAPVYDNLCAYWRLMAVNPNENSATLQGRLDMIRQKAAHFLGAFPDEIAIMRNATECN